MDIGLVCDQCDTLNPIGTPACAACGEPLALVPVTQAVPSARKTLYYSAIQAARAKLVLIKGAAVDGVSYALIGQDHLTGRLEGALVFRDDPYLSPRHANFFFKEGVLHVRDEGSANGIYLRLRGATQIELGATFIVGEQVLRVETPTVIGPNGAVDKEGTYYMASPRRNARLQIVQLMRGGGTGFVHHVVGNAVTLGRENCDLNFAADRFLSARHAQVVWSSPTELTLHDLGSRNGTFLRIENETALHHGDYVFVGQEVLRVEVVS